MLAAERAVRAWVNSHPGLTGSGHPLAGGAYLRQQRSPAEGAYAVLGRTSGSMNLVAEPDPDLCTAGVGFEVFSPTEETAETAAAALVSVIGELTGMPQLCGDTGVMVLAADNISGPVSVPAGADTGEPYCFTLSADFVLCLA